MALPQLKEISEFSVEHRKRCSGKERQTKGRRGRNTHEKNDFSKQMISFTLPFSLREAGNYLYLRHETTEDQEF